MTLGAFSLSLSVKDLSLSKVFYEKLGFTQFAGDLKMNYLIMKNGDALIGLFQGMFTKNIITFNPGWNQNAEQLESFDDVRAIQSHLESNGINLQRKVENANQSGPASIVITDPDGNQILIDQHI